MSLLRRSCLLLIACLTPAAHAGDHATKDALRAARAAAELLEGEGGACERKVGARIDDVIEALKDLRDEGGGRARKAVRQAVERATDAADEHCGARLSSRVAKQLRRAVERMDGDDELERPASEQRESPRTMGFGPFQFQVGSQTRVEQSRAASASVSTRGGGMDADAFDGFLQALRANRNELLRKDAALSTLERNRISARQLGSVLDQFNNEILKLDVARAAAPRVVDPRNAIGLSTKFRNAIHQSEFVALMNQQP